MSLMSQPACYYVQKAVMLNDIIITLKRIQSIIDYAFALIINYTPSLGRRILTKVVQTMSQR